MNPPDYSTVLDLTVQMQNAANAQDWDQLVRIESERRSLLAAIASQSSAPHIDPTSARRTRATIVDIERIDKEIIEQVEAWRNDVARLLGRKTG